MLARALAQEADVFLLDEPASAMDPARQTELFTLLAARAAEGAAILAVLHDINTALLYCDRIVALRSGQIFFSLTPSEVDASLLQVLFDTPFDERATPAGCASSVLLPFLLPCLLQRPTHKDFLMHIITKLTTLLASATLVLALAVPALTAESSPLVFQDDSGTELRLAAPGNTHCRPVRGIQ